jgi:hypothetical protein
VTLPLKLQIKAFRPVKACGLAQAFRLAAATLLALPAFANSTLLESVKQNPQQARALCSELKDLNGQGLSYTSSEAIARVAAQQKLSATDAEILATYVVGLYCPDVR